MGLLKSSIKLDKLKLNSSDKEGNLSIFFINLNPKNNPSKRYNLAKSQDKFCSYWRICTFSRNNSKTKFKKFMRINSFST